MVTLILKSGKLCSSEKGNDLYEFLMKEKAKEKKPKAKK